MLEINSETTIFIKNNDFQIDVTYDNSISCLVLLTHVDMFRFVLGVVPLGLEKET